MLVDLVTPERDLEDLMLKKYPGKIFGEQVAKFGGGKNKVFYFLWLDYGELSKLLMDSSDKNYRFSIFESGTEREIENGNNFINPSYYH